MEGINIVDIVGPYMQGLGVGTLSPECWTMCVKIWGSGHCCWMPDFVCEKLGVGTLSMGC